MMDLPKLLMFLVAFCNVVNGQNCSTMNITSVSDVPSVCGEMVVTMAHDNHNLPLLYVANKEAGLKIYNVADPSSPLLISQIPIVDLGGLDVMNVSQVGDYLFLALGNSFTNPQSAGMAIVNISTPTAPVVTSYYLLAGSSSGGGMVAVEGDFAYLCAMQSGLVIFNIADKSNIVFVSQFIPDINYPYPSPPNPNFYNLRSCEVRNQIVYACYDAGGFRVINCTSPVSPVETGHYANPLLYFPFNLTRAYNNVVIDDSLVYIAVDYCGMEVLDISDTAAINLIGWWNPQNCPGNNWFTSPVHTNEIRFNKACNQLFLSSGKSEMYVLDVSNPSLPDSCNSYGSVTDSTGTWGVNIFENQIYLSYICTFGIPFISNSTGLKILTYTSCTSDINSLEEMYGLRAYPNPAQRDVYIDFNGAKLRYTGNSCHVFDITGRQMKVSPVVIDNKLLRIDVSNFQSGIYFVEFNSEGKQIRTRIVKE